MIKTLNIEKQLGDENIHVNILDTPTYASVVFTWRYRKKEWSVGKEVERYNQNDQAEWDWLHEVRRLIHDEVDAEKTIRLIYPFSYPSDWRNIAKEWIRRVSAQMTPSDFATDKWVIVDRGLPKHRNI